MPNDYWMKLEKGFHGVPMVKENVPKTSGNVTRDQKRALERDREYVLEMLGQSNQQDAINEMVREGVEKKVDVLVGLMRQIRELEKELRQELQSLKVQQGRTKQRKYKLQGKTQIK